MKTQNEAIYDTEKHSVCVDVVDYSGYFGNSVQSVLLRHPMNNVQISYDNGRISLYVNGILVELPQGSNDFYVSISKEQ